MSRTLKDAPKGRKGRKKQHEGGDHRRLLDEERRKERL